MCEEDKESIKGQILRTLKSKHLKNKTIISFDIETQGIDNNFYMAGLYDGKEYYSFYDKEKLIKFLFEKARKNSTLEVVATNLMFDFSGVFYNTKYWNDFTLVMKQGKMLMAEYKDPNKHFTLKFIDTLNYAQMGVATMGKILGKPKFQTPKCIENKIWVKEKGILKHKEVGYARIPVNKSEEKELEDYNKQDCIITYEFMIFLQEGFKSFGGKTKLTTSSTAMDIFRRKHLKKWVFKEDYVLKRNKNNTIHKFIFASYSGGRTEVFKRGRERRKLKVYDINSMYPHAMLNEMPDPSSVRYTRNPKKWMLEFEGISNVFLEVPRMYYPLLANKRYNKQGEVDKLLFPCGWIRGVYTHVELRKALELGYRIIKMKETLYYKRTMTPFKSYVEEIYEKKKEYSKTENPLVSVTKLLLNGLYGKFAEKKADEVKIIDPTLMSSEEAKKYRGQLQLTMSGLLTSTTKKEVYKPHVIPIWASYTTAYARLNLYHYLNKYKAYYCDTDSCATRKEMPESNKLGGMKLEYDVTDAIFVKPKMYMYKIVGGNYKVRLKGVSGATQEKFMDIMNNKAITFNKFTKLKEAVKRGMNPNSVQIVEKSLNLEDDKRHWIQKFNPDELQNSFPKMINTI